MLAVTHGRQAIRDTRSALNCNKGGNMAPEITERLNKPIPAVAECADFGPAYEGEDYVTLTFRVPKDTPATVGKWDLTPRGTGTFDWAVQKNAPAVAEHGRA